MKRSIFLTGLAGAVAAGIVDLIVFAVARGAGANFAFVQNGKPTDVTYALVGVVSVGAVVVGSALAALLGERRLRLSQAIGAAVAVLSTGGPLSLTGAASAKGVLVALHLLTGVIFVSALEVARRRARAVTPSEVRAPVQ
jgi:lysylphosphatidylglycerol synthetase-like protein (DUF2156 family)